MELDAQPLVSVIIPTFNRAEIVRHTILSVLEQSYTNLEVIVIDDASTDDTSIVVQSIDDARVKYLRLGRNSGPSEARNAGIRSAKGEFVCFLDSDDIWEKQKTELQIDAISHQRDPVNTVSYTKALIVRNGKKYALPIREKREDEPIADYVCGNFGLIHTSSLMLSLDLALANPFPLDQRIFEDWDLLLRLEAKGVNWHYLDQPLITWNNDSRPDRLTLQPHDGSNWLERHKIYMSKRACNAFALKGIAYPLIKLRKRKFYTVWILVQALFGNQISITKFLKYMLKIFFKPSLIKMLRERIYFHSRSNGGHV